MKPLVILTTLVAINFAPQAVGLSAAQVTTSPQKTEDGTRETKDGLSKRLLGYWAPEEKAFIETMRIQSKVALDAGEASEEEVEDMAKEIASAMVFVFKADSTAVMHSERGAEKRKFEVLAIRQETNEIDVDFTDTEGKKEKGTIVLRKGLLILKPRGDEDRKRPTIAFQRLGEAEAKKRLARIEALRGGE